MKRTTFLVISFLCVFALGHLSVFGQGKKFEKVTFKSKDGLKVAADFYPAVAKDHKEYRKRPVILMFHKARSSRGEYRKIAPRFVSMGFHCLAVDLRSGEKSDRSPKVVNETAKRAHSQGKKMNYMAAYQDMEATLSWVKKKKFKGSTLVWGSSYSAALVFKLGADHYQEVDLIVSYSPGEYIKGHSVRKWVENTKGIPIFIGCGSGAKEKSRAKKLFKSVKGRRKFHQAEGTHGSYILLDQADNIQPLKKFLKPYIPSK